MNINPFLATDGYKVDHHRQYPEGTTLVYSNFTPRAAKHAPKGVNKDYIISFGQQMVMRQIKEMFDENFFKTSERAGYSSKKQPSINFSVNSSIRILRDRICQEIKKEYSTYLGVDYDVSHIEALWDLGYLPIKVKALPEGSKVPIGVPVLTIVNTKPEFFWLTNFLETLISNLLWKPMTSATIAYNYKENLQEWANKTDKENVGFVDFQGHDFSMRGMDSVDATISSGLGHATSFLGSDSLPVIHGARKYYDEEGMVIAGVPATEHSVMCAGSKDDEIGTFGRLLGLYPTGILSVVSDTWDLWKVITEYLPTLKEEILARDGKLVIRPDSGDPVDIICGTQKFYKLYHRITNGYETVVIRNYYDVNKIYFDGENYYKCEVLGSEGLEHVRYKFWKIDLDKPEKKGVIELLWGIFGGTTNDQGYKVLDPHIGAIYGDSITLERADEICRRLEAKGFASTNIVLGIGSFTYQYNTRDTFGFAMKATYVEIEGWEWYNNVENTGWETISTSDMDAIIAHGLKPQPQFRKVNKGREIFKDPITDDGTKKSAKGLLKVAYQYEKYALIDQVDWEEESRGYLQTIFEDGKFSNQTTLTEIRKRLK